MTETVWVVHYVEYDQHDVIIVGATVERAVAAPLDKDLRAALLVGAQWREVDCSMRSLRDDSGRVLGAVFVIRHCALPDIDDERRSFEVAVP